MARVPTALVAVTVLLLALFAGDAIGALSVPGATRPTPAGYARVKDGESVQTVARLLGRRFSICTSCAPHTWVYEMGPDPIAIVVHVVHGTVANSFLVRPRDDV